MGFHLNSSRRAVAIWTTVAAFLGFAILQPSAYGLEFPMTSQIEIGPEIQSKALAENSLPNLSAAALYGSIDLAATPVGAIFSSEMALVSSISLQVEMARTISGAKMVAKVILFDEYGMNEGQFTCLNKLWTKESNWRPKAKNKHRTAYGIPQLLKMKETNPYKQIDLGLKYIAKHRVYKGSPCKALNHHKKRGWY